MPEYIRALVVILTLAAAVFFIARKPASETGLDQDFGDRRNLWFGLTIAAFISHSFVVFAVLSSLVLLIAKRRETYPLALFFSLLFLIPPASYQVPGFGLINYLIHVDHVRLLVLLVLLPAALYLSGKPGVTRLGSLLPDKLLGAFLLLVVALRFRDTSFTDGIRHVLYLILDVLLPYYVASRSLRDINGFKNVLFSFVLSVLIIAAVGIFEYSRHWLLYRAVVDALDLQWGFGNYLQRSGTLRASASTGQAIVLGYLITVALGFLLFLSDGIKSRLQYALMMLILLGGLFASLSRGPWIGFAALIAIFIVTGRAAIQKLILLTLAGFMAIAALAVIPGGSKIIDLLPFIGSVEKGNIDYRQRLIDNSLAVIERNLWFGSNDYLRTPEMVEMLQGEGIIDIVNSYIGLALNFGIVGLTFFALFFLTVLYYIYKAMRTDVGNRHDVPLLGRVLFATTVAILLIIVTVSSISFIPIVYWAVAGIGVAYAQMVRKLSQERRLA